MELDKTTEIVFSNLFHTMHGKVQFFQCTGGVGGTDGLYTAVETLTEEAAVSEQYALLCLNVTRFSEVHD